MPDIGSYFDKLTKRAPGGRRTTGKRTTRTGSSGSATGGSMFDRMRDMANKAKDQVQSKVSDTKTSTSSRSRSRATVTIEYSPAIDGDPDPGDVVWTWVPFEEDPSQGKDRPVVIIGRRNNNLVGIPLTTKSDNREAQVNIGTGDWDPERRVSYARIWRLLDVDESRMRREGAILERDRFDAIIAAVDDYYDVTYPAAASAKSDELDYDY